MTDIYHMTRILLLSIFLSLFFNIGLAQQEQYEWAFSTNQFDKANDFSDGYAIVKKKYKRGFIDRSGAVVIQPQYNIIDAFSENTASAGYVNYQTSESASGYINRLGEFVIEPQFEVTSPFQEGLACVKKNDRWGFIDHSGKFVIEAQFEEANVFSKGKAAVKKDGLWGIINTSGQFIIPPKYDYLLGFSEGLSAVYTEGKWGYIDQTGKMVIEAQFESAASFSDGRARVEMDRKFGMINSNGTYVIEPSFTMLHNFSQGFAVAKKNAEDLWGYINTNGEYVIAPEFELTYDFSENLARVRKNGKWGYINLKGNIAIDPVFDVAYDFKEGLARVKQGDKRGFIRYLPPKKEELVIDQPKAKPEELTVRDIKQGHRIVVKDSKITLSMIDHKKIDGDIISLNYNGKWLVRKQLLAKEPHKVDFEIDPLLEDNYILFYAENLGRNPPNTATIFIESGGEKQIIVLEADLNQCDIIRFEME